MKNIELLIDGLRVSVSIALTPRHISSITGISNIQLVVYYQCCVLIGSATTRLYVIAN